MGKQAVFLSGRRCGRCCLLVKIAQFFDLCKRLSDFFLRVSRLFFEFLPRFGWHCGVEKARRSLFFVIENAFSL